MKALRGIVPPDTEDEEMKREIELGGDVMVMKSDLDDANTAKIVAYHLLLLAEERQRWARPGETN